MGYNAENDATRPADVIRECQERYRLASEAEARKRGERTGLDTRVVHAVNDEY